MFKELCDLRKYYGAEGNLFVFRQEGGKKRHLAEFLFDNALKKGELKKGMPVAEITAGNFGLALAKLCAKNKSRLYLVPIGKLDSKTLKRLKKFDVVLVEAVPKEGEKYWQALYRTLDETIESQKAFSFKQFESREQIDYYLNLFELFPDITVDCCFDKMGCGATLAALHKKYPKATILFTDYYEIEYQPGTLTVEAMIINEENVVVTLDRDTYDGGKIGYTIQISGVTVAAGDHLDISLTKDGSDVNEIKDAGEYVFAIKGDDTFYQGNVNITVTVNKADISDVDFWLDKTSATYTGSAIEVKANTTIAVSLAVTQEGKEAQLINAGTYTVTVTPTDPNYTGSKEFTFTINKASHEKPVESDLKIEVTWNSVTVTHDEFIVQLSKDGSTGWVDTTMGGYDANSSYTLHVRFKEDANHSLGGSTMISGKTAERTAVEFEITDVEEHYNRAVLTITFEEAFSGTVQFSIDGDWKDLTVQDGKYVASGLAESTEYTLQVKIPAGDDYLESEVKSVKVKTGVDPAKYTETLAMFGETFSAGDLVNYETLKEQFNGLTEADKAGVDAAKFATITAARDKFVASVNSDIEDIQNVAAKTAGRAVAAAAAAVTAAAIALFIAKRKFI